MGFLVASSFYNVSACSVASLGFAYVQLVGTHFATLLTLQVVIGIITFTWPYH